MIGADAPGDDGNLKPATWTVARLDRTPVQELDDYLPVPLRIIANPITRSPAVSQIRPIVPRADIDLALAHDLVTRVGRLSADLHALVLACCRGARSVYVHGGTPQVRRQVALVLATALEPDAAVDWDDPNRVGVHPAPLRIAPARKGWRSQ